MAADSREITDGEVRLRVPRASAATLEEAAGGRNLALEETAQAVMAGTPEGDPVELSQRGAALETVGAGANGASAAPGLELSGDRAEVEELLTDAVRIAAERVHLHAIEQPDLEKLAAALDETQSLIFLRQSAFGGPGGRLSEEQVTRASLAGKQAAHETRIRVLVRMLDGPLSPSDYAAAAPDEEGVGRISYHFRALADGGLIGVARLERRRGAIKTYYGITDTGRALVRWLGAAPAGVVRSATT